MKLNGVTCVGYGQVTEGFSAILLDTTFEAISALSVSAINITADDNAVVATFKGFGAATRITKDVSLNRYEVLFPNEDFTQQRVTQLEAENAALKSQLTGTQAALDFLMLNNPT